MLNPEAEVRSLPALDLARDTLVSLFRDTVRARADSGALRGRAPLGWESLSWREYGVRAASFAAGLRARGVGPGDHVVLMLRNTPEFYVVDMGCLLIGAVPVSVYDSPSVDRLAHVLRDCRAAAVVVSDGRLLDRAQAAARGLSPLLVGVAADAQGEGVEPYASLLDADPVDLDECARRVSPDETAVMLYTSGTAGPPKGVPLTHSNMVHAADSFNQRSGVSLTGLRQLSYLPMAHIGERFATHYLHLVHGSEVTCCASLDLLPGTLQEVHPHMFFGAPRMWENLYTSVMRRLETNPDERAAFEAAAPATGAPATGAPGARPEAVRRLLSAVGLDEVLVAIVGSAPLPRHVHEFWLRCGIPLADFYGQTETSGMGSWDPHDIRLGTVGRPLPHVEIRIADDGEILTRSPMLFRGYYKDERKTRKVIDADGWYHTGDLGRLDDDGNLVYIGRANDMIVPTSGHNVSPVHLESSLLQSPLVAHACVVGTGRPHIAAVLIVDAQAAADWLTARSEGGSGAEADAVEHPAVLQELQRLVDEVNRDLPGAERIRSFRLVSDGWTNDSDVLTATGKMRRGQVAKRYEQLIDDMYRDAAARRAAAAAT